MTQNAQRPSEEQRLLERLAACIHLVRAELRPRAHALLLGEHLTLALSDGLDQHALDDLTLVRAKLPAGLRQGTACRGTGRRPFLLLPAVGRDGLQGLLYLELEQLSRVPSRMQLLVDLLSRAALLEDAAPSLADTAPLLAPEAATAEEPPATEAPPDPTAKLVALLERNEWNVSRVARILGVTRMTVYNRLRRAKVSRVRVPKPPPPRQARPSERQSA